MVDLSPGAHRLHVISGLIVALLVFAVMVVTPRCTREPLNRLQQIQQRGYINVLTRNAASTYYQDDSGGNGFEYHLVRLFADYLQVEPHFIVVDALTDIYDELQFNGADLAAAGLSQQDLAEDSRIEFGPAYHLVHQQLLYRKGNHPRPRKFEDLENGIIEVLEGTSHQRLLEQLEDQYEELSWRVNKDIAAEELIELVDEGLIDFILADSHEIALQRRFFPELRVAFEVGKPKHLRWAIKKSEDQSLQEQMQAFFEQIMADGRLEQLIHRHYSHVEEFNYSDLQTFSNHVRDRLPEFQDWFQQEAAEHDLDWRLLAAIGYQESLWDPKAKSPTGVRGLMMLTQNTAKLVKIKNRLDPQQSIRGGAIYFKRVLEKIPERIPQPDRTWLALASYNVGFGHLEDARKITESTGGDPDKWIDVKESLPLLARKKWYKNTRHGYARGWEPVKYVENIRKYYDLLVWMDDRRTGNVNPTPRAPTSEELLLAPSF